MDGLPATPGWPLNASATERLTTRPTVLEARAATRNAARCGEIHGSNAAALSCRETRDNNQGRDSDRRHSSDGRGTAHAGSTPRRLTPRRSQARRCLKCGKRLWGPIFHLVLWRGLASLVAAAAKPSVLFHLLLQRAHSLMTSQRENTAQNDRATVPARGPRCRQRRIRNQRASPELRRFQ